MGRNIDEKKFEDVMEILTYCRQVIGGCAREIMHDADECLENLDDDASLQKYRVHVQKACIAYGNVCEKIDRLVAAMGQEVARAKAAADKVNNI